MIELKVTLEGEKQLSRRLLTIPSDISDFKRPLFRIGAEVRGSIDTNFSSRGALFGRWVPRKDNLPHPLLEKTSAMRRNFKQTSERTISRYLTRLLTLNTTSRISLVSVFLVV
jgi:hypothetical protein